MSFPEYLYCHRQTEDGTRTRLVTTRYRVVRVTKRRAFVARNPEGEWQPEDGTFSFSREAIERGEVVGARGHELLTPNPDAASYWKAMGQAVLVEGKTQGPIVA